MLRDYDTRMLESHRLTPMSNIAVVLGYMFGPTLQILSLFALVLMFGAALAFASGQPVGPWVLGNLILLNGSFTLWGVVVLAGLRMGKPISPAGFLIGLGVFGNVGILMLPAAGVLLSAYSTFLGLGVVWGMVNPTVPVVVAMVALHMLLTWFWLLAAADKYRRPDLPALNGPRGLLLLCVWLTVGTLGIVLADIGMSGAGIGFPGGGDLDAKDVMWSVTMGLALVVALIPISGAVECRMLARRGASLRGWPDHMTALMAALVAPVLICGLMLVLGLSLWPDWLGRPDQGEMTLAWMARRWGFAWGATLLACVSAMLTARAIVLISYSWMKSPRMIVGLFVLLFWGVPPLADFIVSSALETYNKPLKLTWVFGAAPTGTIAIIWNQVTAPITAGLAAQAALAIALSVVAHRVSRRGRKTSADSAPTPRIVSAT
jgi:hypothetical protein